MTLFMFGCLLAGCAAPAPVAVNVSPGSTFKDCANCPEMVALPTGSFTLGSPPQQQNGVDQQQTSAPQRVKIIKSYAVSKFEITVDQYRQYAEDRGFESVNWHVARYAASPDDAFPVIWLSWNDAVDYVQWLSQHTGHHYRLLTEVEWEYVALAGGLNADLSEPADTKASQENDQLPKSETTFRVGTFRPNAFGIYDMTGNIPEWTADCYTNGPSVQTTAGASAAMTASPMAGACDQRVIKGTYNFNPPEYYQISYRSWNHAEDRYASPPAGLRIARDLP
jgi:formylglycine-generating enzyme required for sulfatase activity